MTVLIPYWDAADTNTGLGLQLTIINEFADSLLN